MQLTLWIQTYLLLALRQLEALVLRHCHQARQTLAPHIQRINDQARQTLAPYTSHLVKAARPAALAGALALVAGGAVVAPAAKTSADPEVIEMLPPDVRLEVVRLNDSVGELEARTQEMVKRVKPGPDVLDQVGGRTRNDWAKLRHQPVDDAAINHHDVKSELAAANHRIETMAESLRIIKNTIDARRAMTEAMPLTRPVNGVVTSPYGWRRSPTNGKPSLHEGVDIAAPKGSVIVAPADAVVVSTAKHQGYGDGIVLDHGYGVSTVFAHLSRIDVKEGTRVKRGQPIALIGVSGRSTGPHLHYEVRIDGEPVDPQPFLTFDVAKVEALAAPGT